MVYFLKFCASFVLPPGIFIVGFFFLAFLLLRKREKKIAACLFCLNFAFYFASTGFVSERLMGELEDAYAPPPDPHCDAIVMLGGGAIADAPDADGLGALTGSANARLFTCYRLYRRLHVPIILSGGQVYETSGREGEIAKKILVGLGLPEKDVLVEGKSINTTQNAKFTAKMLKERRLTKPLIVTSAFHMRRAMLNFEQNGVYGVPYPTDYQVSRKKTVTYTKFRPQGEALLLTATVLQEYLRTMVTKYWGF